MNFLASQNVPSFDEGTRIIAIESIESILLRFYGLILVVWPLVNQRNLIQMQIWYQNHLLVAFDVHQALYFEAVVNLTLYAHLGEKEAVDNLPIALKKLQFLIKKSLNIKIAKANLVHLALVLDEVHMLHVLKIEAFPLEIRDDLDEVAVELLLPVLAEAVAIVVGVDQQVPRAEHSLVDPEQVAVRVFPPNLVWINLAVELLIQHFLRLEDHLVDSLNGDDLPALIGVRCQEIVLQLLDVEPLLLGQLLQVKRVIDDDALQQVHLLRLVGVVQEVGKLRNRLIYPNHLIVLSGLDALLFQLRGYVVQALREEESLDLDNYQGGVESFK